MLDSTVFSYDVLIPNYNRTTLLLRAVNSALNQTQPPNRIIIVDDGSDAKTKEFYHRHLSGLKKVQIHELPRNGNPGRMRAFGLEKATSNYVAFLDSDDYWFAEKMEVQISHFAQNTNESLIAVSSNALCKSIRNPNSTDKLITSLESKSLNYALLLKNNVIVNSSVVIHRTLLKSHLRYPEHRWLLGFEDYCFWLKLSLCYEINYLESPLVFYENNSEDSVRKYKKRFLDERLQALIYIMFWSVKNYSCVSNRFYLANTFAQIIREGSLFMVRKFQIWIQK